MSAGRVFGGLGLLLARVATAGLFAWAAYEKLKSPRNFYFNIKGFEVFRGGAVRLIEPLAFMVPWTELVCAAALLLGLWARSAAIVLGAMLLAFIGAIASVLIRGLHVECGCFGDFAALCPPGAVGWCNIGQNAMLFAIALPVMLWGPGFLSWDAVARAGCGTGKGCRGGCCSGKGGGGTAEVDSAPVRS